MNKICCHSVLSLLLLSGLLSRASAAETVEPTIAVTPGGYFPVLVKTDDELVAVVRGGAPHVGVGGRLDLIRSKDGGKTWSKPVTVADEMPDARNPAFGVLPKGGLVLAYSVTGEYPNGKFTQETSGRYSSWVRTSEDGKTFSKPMRLTTDPYPYSSPYGKIVSLPDGTLLMAVYAWHPPAEKRGDFSTLVRSSDGGKTWSAPTLIAKGHNETSLVVLPENKVLAVMRTEKGGLAQSLSKDGGKTWSEAKALLGGSEHPGDVIRLASGKLLLAFGHRKAPFGVQAIWSDDSGETWSLPKRAVLEPQSTNTDCGYPSSVQLGDGTIVTMYYGVGHKAHPKMNQYAMVVRYREADLAGLAPAEPKK